MHTYPALVVNCMDPRLQGSNAEAIAWAAGFQPGSWEQLSYAGPSLWLADPHEASHADSFRWLLEEVSGKVHQVHTVVLVGHSGCGGFKLKHGSMEPVQEKATIVASLRSAADELKRLKSDLNVILVFATIHEYQPEGKLPAITCEVITPTD